MNLDEGRVVDRENVLGERRIRARLEGAVDPRTIVVQRIARNEPRIPLRALQIRIGAASFDQTSVGDSIRPVDGHRDRICRASGRKKWKK
jgi:hypothetical protein